MKNTSNYLNPNKKKSKLKNAPRDFSAPQTKFKKKRLCLKCAKKFQSKGPYNRLCEKCTLVNERMAASSYSVSSSAGGESRPSIEQLYELN